MSEQPPEAAAEPVAKPARRRGLGELGKQAFERIVPVLVLLPRRDEVTLEQLLGLCGLSRRTLLAWARAVPELELTADEAADEARRYSRAQLGQLLRLKHLVQEQRLSLEEARARLLNPDAPVPPPAAPPRPAPPPAGAAAAAPSLSGEALAYLQDELSALLALAQEPELTPEPAKT